MAWKNSKGRHQGVGLICRHSDMMVVGRGMDRLSLNVLSLAY